MGWVSTLEDIVERFGNGLASFEQYKPKPGMTREEFAARERDIEKLIVTCKQIKRRIEEYIDLATDPNVSLAYELEFQEIYVKELQRDLKRIERQRDDSQRQLCGITFNQNIASARITKLEQENQELRGKLERREKHEKRMDSRLKKIQKPNK